MVWIALMCAILLNSSANILIKLGMQRFDFKDLWGLFSNWQLLLGMACFALNLGCYAYALSKLRLSIAYPIMMSLSFAIVIATSAFYLKESLTRGQVGGLLLIVIGIVFVAKDLGK